MMAAGVNVAIVVLFAAAMGIGAPAAHSADLNVCDFIAQHQADLTWYTEFPPAFGPRSEFLRDYFVRHGWFDLDGDGIAEEVTRETLTGTMGGDAYKYSLSSIGKEPPEFVATDAAAGLPAGVATYLDNRLTLGQAFLPFKGHFYEVNFMDEGGAFVVDALYYQRDGSQRAACAFKNQVTVQHWLSSWDTPPQFKADVQVVWRLADQRQIADNPVTASTRLAESASAARYLYALPGGRIQPACQFRGSDCKDVWNVDFDNDGATESLLLLSGGSGAGGGCSLSYFMLLTPEGGIASGAKQDLLLKLQHVQLGDAYPVRPCGMEFRWLNVAGRTLLERRSAHQPPLETLELVDDLWIARGGQTTRLTYAAFKVTPEIIYGAPPK